MSTSKLAQTRRNAASWWASSSRRARWTGLGAVALVVALGGTSAFVWTSPGNPVTQALTNGGSDISGGGARATQSKSWQAEKERLMKTIQELRSSLATGSVNLKATNAKSAALQQALWSAEGALNALKANKPAKAAAPPAAAPTAITAPSKAELLNPASSYLGLYTEQAPFNWATYDATSTGIGSTPNVVGYFGGWDETFRANAVTRAWERKTLPILTWESRPIGSANDVVTEPDYTLPAIIGDAAAGIPGRYDEYLHQYARDIVATGLPLGIRLNHEMNGTWYPWSESDSRGNPINSNRPGDYVKMWQHVHDIFAAEGANELVMWIWAPNIINNLPDANKASAFLDGLYPGDDYVDWVGLSGYLRPPYKTENTFSFEYTFDASLRELRRITNKPIFLAEIGASEIDGHKKTWITSLFEGLARSENDDIVGFSWFNMAVTSKVEGELATNDWRIDSREDTLAAFVAGLARPDSDFNLVPR